jgi:hypothetical protein
MSTENTSPPPGPDAGTDDIQADIEQTRQALGETVEALSAKADVKARAKQKAADTKARLTESVGPITALVATAVIIGIVLWRRRH